MRAYVAVMGIRFLVNKSCTVDTIKALQVPLQPTGTFLLFLMNLTPMASCCYQLKTPVASH